MGLRQAKDDDGRRDVALRVCFLLFFCPYGFEGMYIRGEAGLYSRTKQRKLKLRRDDNEVGYRKQSLCVGLFRFTAMFCSIMKGSYVVGVI